MYSVYRKKAIALRKLGYSYHQVLAHVPVAKSTLSLWLRSVGLSRQQKQRLTKRRRAAGRRGAQKRLQQRLDITKRLQQNAKKHIGEYLSKRELLLIGAALYWAEGTKEQEARPGSGVQFTNSDPVMVKFFLRWLRVIFAVPRKSIYFELYVHESNAKSVRAIQQFWAATLNYDVSHFACVYYKKNARSAKPHARQNYQGVVKVRVRASSHLVRTMQGWVQGMYAAKIRQ